jgi:hypothetical protein
MGTSMTKGKNRGNAAVLGTNQVLKKGGNVKRMQSGGSARLQRKLEKEKQKQEIYNVQGYENKRDKSDAQAKRASDILGGGKTKYKNNTSISNDSSSSSRNTNANQNANQNSSSSSSSSNARGGAGGSSTVRATGGNDISTNVNRANQVSGGYQNQSEQDMGSKNGSIMKRQKGGLIKSKNKIMRTKTKKMQVGGINSNNRKSTSNRTNTNTNTTVDSGNDYGNYGVSVGRATQVSGGKGNKSKQQINSGNDNSRKTTNQSQRSTNVRQSSSSNRSTTNNNRSNVGNRSSSTSQRVGGYKKGGMTKSKKK